MFNNKILFSIIVTTYNDAKYIDKCLLEIKKQCNDETELIIVDDGSNDDTISICKNRIIGIKNVRIIVNEHQGLSNSRNVGKCYLDKEQFNSIINNCFKGYNIKYNEFQNILGTYMIAKIECEDY